jgi:hypothetical protein
MEVRRPRGGLVPERPQSVDRPGKRTGRALSEFEARPITGIEVFMRPRPIIIGLGLRKTANSSDLSDVTSLPSLSAASFGSFQRILFPAFHPRGGSRALIDGPKPWSHMGAIASPAGLPPQRNDGNPRGLDDPLLSRGFHLVAGVASKSTVSHSYLQPASFVLVQILR